MKRLIMALVAVFSLIIIGVICLLAVAINRGGIGAHYSYSHSSSHSYSYSTLKLVNEQTASLAGVEDILIDYTSDDVEFFTSDTEELVLKEYMSFPPEEDELTLITQSGTGLKLLGRINDNNNWLLHPNHASRMEVYLPSDYQGALEVRTSSGNITSDLVMHNSDFSASATSGNIELNEINAPRITCSTSSGELKVEKAEGKRSFSATSGNIEVYGGAGDTYAATSSGDITIENSTGVLEAEASSGNIDISSSIGEKSISTTSGNIRIEASEGYTKAEASSGNIIVTDLAGAGTFDTTSGEMQLDFAEAPTAYTEDIIIEASSGNAEVTLPSTLQFDFTANTSSGNINTYFDDELDFSKDGDYAKGTIGANPSFKLDISTTSGNIEVDER